MTLPRLALGPVLYYWPRDTLLQFYQDIAAGRLQVVLGEFNSGYRQPIHAVYYRNSQLALRIQCFLDFIQTKLASYAAANFTH